MATIFTGGRVLDGRGGMRDRGTVIVDGPHITATPAKPSRPGPDDRVVDLHGATLLPGLIDTHIHCVGGDYFPDYETEDVAVAVLRTAAVMRKTLTAGITTVRTAASRDYLDIGVRDAIRMGIASGPRILASGRAITITGGHMASVAVAADGPDEVRKAVREHVSRGVDSIKLMMSSGVATSGLDIQAPQFTLDEVQTATYEAHKAGRKVLTHAIGQQAIRDAVTAGVDSIDHGDYLDEETASIMAEKGIFMVPTFCPNYYYTVERIAEAWRIERAEAVSGQREKALRIALDAGVRIAMGSDCGAPSRMPNGRNALELRLMVNNGMSEMAAVVAGTSAAAELIGLPQIGAIEAGKIADLIVVEGNPLENISVLETATRFVMQAGIVRRDDFDRDFSSDEARPAGSSDSSASRPNR